MANKSKRVLPSTSLVPFEDELDESVVDPELDPETDGSDPETDGLDPETDGSDPETDGLDPETDGSDPETDGLDPETDGLEGREGASVVICFPHSFLHFASKSVFGTEDGSGLGEVGVDTNVDTIVVS